MINKNNKVKQKEVVVEVRFILINVDADEAYDFIDGNMCFDREDWEHIKDYDIKVISEKIF